MRWIILTLLTLSLANPVFAMGKKPSKNRLTFHLQGQRSDGPKMVIPVPMGGKQLFFRKSPLTFTKEIVSYKPFFADDGTAGATFAFKPATRQRIAAITNQNRQKWILAMLNGRPVDAVYIEKPVVDGKLVIWQGIKQSEIIQFDYVIPHTGESHKAWKARLKNFKIAKKARKKAAKEAAKLKRR